MSRKHHKRLLTILDLPFKSILDDRPYKGQFVLIAWDINGFCGFTSTYWDIESMECQHCVMWMPLLQSHIYTRNCAVSSCLRAKATILKWSQHFSVIINNYYISKSKLPKKAETI